jgi:hypothetical protein
MGSQDNTLPVAQKTAKTIGLRGIYFRNYGPRTLQCRE